MIDPMERWIELDGCDNFRDIGGYATREGRTIRWRTVFRSDALGALTRTTIDRASRDLGLRTLIDLRSPDEHVRLRPPNGLATQIVSIAMDNPDISALRESGAAGMGELYLWNLDVKREGVARIVRLLADAQNLPAVIQCTGGKDRTGIVVALVLELLGVPDETIVEDYILTDLVRTRPPIERYEEAVQRLVSMNLDPAILGTHRGTMQTFLDGFRKRYGSAEGYVAEAGITPAEIDAMRENLLEVADD